MMKKATVFLVLLTVSALVEPTRVRSQQPPALSSATFERLKFRSIGPATMSGRIVDIAVVESNTYTSLRRERDRRSLENHR